MQEQFGREQRNASELLLWTSVKMTLSECNMEYTEGNNVILPCDYKLENKTTSGGSVTKTRKLRRLAKTLLERGFCFIF